MFEHPSIYLREHEAPQMYLFRFESFAMAGGVV